MISEISYSSLRRLLGCHSQMCWLHWRVSVPLSRWDVELVRHILCWSAILICSECYWAPGTVSTLSNAWFVGCWSCWALWVRTHML